MRLPERQIPALGLALALGFLEGLIATTLELHGGVLWVLAIVGVVVVMGASLLSMVGLPADRSDALLTALIRGALAAGVFVCLFTGLQQLGGSGQIATFLILMVIAGALALVSTRIRTRALVPEEATTEDEAQEAEKLEDEREQVRERELSSERERSSDRDRETA